MAELSALAVKYNTDKWGHHYYTEHYQKTLQHLKEEPITLLEIGIGGYEYPDRGGASLRMWAEFFPKAKIVGFDYYDKSKLQLPPNVETVQGDQSKFISLADLDNEKGPFDVVIDDGSHQCRHQLYSFEVLFPRLKPNGIYIIEDVETSYWPDYGGHPTRHNINTCLGYFMDMIHKLNYRTNGRPADYFTEKVESIQFFNNIIIIRKGYNA